MLNELNLSLGKIRTTSPRRILCSALVLSLLAWCGMQIPGYISYSFTDSVGHTWFYVRKGRPAHISSGDIVIFSVSIDQALVPNCMPCNITKIVGCLPGQHLKTQGRDFFCDGVFLGEAKTHSQQGVSVEAISYDGVIPENHFFATGTCKDSYDSKYFGLVRQDIIKGIGLPLF
ncbi:MAG: S26 family signal peptidase [Proteobacteria bacterium]|nr:S26 family signal peptidase [Pseudomonadota bacterium]